MIIVYRGNSKLAADSNSRNMEQKKEKKIMECRKKKNRKRKIMASLLALCLAASGTVVSPLGWDTVKAQESEGDIRVTDSQGNDYRYRELEGGGLEITAFEGPSEWDGNSETEAADLTVPAVLNGKNVVRIGNEAFCGDKLPYCRNYIKKITIPEGVTGIGNTAFGGCQKLEEVVLPEGITMIEHAAFKNCSKLNRLIFPESLVSMEFDMISGCESLTEITVPENVSGIASQALTCEGLTAIHVAEENPCYASQDGVLYNKNKTVLLCYPGGRSGAFTIPETVEKIGDDAFYFCKHLTDVTITGKVEQIGDFAFYGLSLTQVKIPGNVKKIGSNAFACCYNLEKIILEEGIETIGSDAFLLSSITDITIPASVTELGNDVFGECTNLSAIHVAEANRNYSSEDGILYDKGKTILLFCPKAKIKPEEVRITVPDTVQNIAEYAFDHGSGWQKHVTLVCYEGSPAQKYAEEHEMKFEASRAAHTFMITFDANGGTVAGNTSLAVTEGKTLRDMGFDLPAANRAGYNFLGWYTARADGTEVTAETWFTGSQTVYAHWEQQPSEDNSSGATQPGDSNGSVQQPEDSPQPEQTVTYTVTFRKNGGSKVSKTSITVAKGQKIGKLPTAQRKGYTLKGWYTSKKGGTKLTSSTKITRNQTVYAQWTKVVKPKKAGKPSLKSQKNGQLTVKYRKISGAKGYEICYSTKKNFKSSRKMTTSKTKAVIRKLKKKTIYYVKVRAYKLDSTGRKIYGNYGAFQKRKTE